MPRRLLVATTSTYLLLYARGVGAQVPRRAYGGVGGGGGRGSGGNYGAGGGGYSRSASPSRPPTSRGGGGHGGGRGGGGRDEGGYSRQVTRPRQDGYNDRGGGRDEGGYSRQVSRPRPDDFDDDRLADGGYSRRSGNEYADDGEGFWDEDAVVPTFEMDDGSDYIYGVNSVLTALQVKRRKPGRLLLQDSMVLSKRKDGALVTAVERLATEAGVPIARVDKHRLNMITGNRPHQGIALQASKLEFKPMQTMVPPPEGGARAVWLALDEVTDPQNLGSLLRSALFLGAAGVLVSEKNSAPLSPAVSRASAGAMELMQVHATRNLVKTLNGARESGWLVVGAAFDDSVTVADLDSTRPTILVLGSEGMGLRTSVLRECETIVRVPRARSGATAVAPEHESLVDSLNVGVAGGVLLSSLIRAGSDAASE